MALKSAKGCWAGDPPTPTNPPPPSPSLCISSLPPQVIRSIGYKSVPVDDEVPFDPKLCIIPNVGGRVVSSGELARLYPESFSYLQVSCDGTRSI